MKERKPAKIIARLVTNTNPSVVLYLVWRPRDDEEYAAESDLHEATIRGRSN